MNRRTFLGVLGAVAACGDNLDGGRFGGFRMGVQSWTFRVFSLDDTLAMMNGLGLTRIELSPGDRLPGHLHFPEPPEDTIAMRDKIRAAGIDCVTAHIPLPLEGVNEELNRQAFEYARLLGARTLLVDPPLEALDHLESLCVEFDRRIAIHNHVYSTRFNYVDQVLAAVKGRDPRVGALVDTGHYAKLEEDPAEAIRRLGDRVLGVHLKDVDGLGIDAHDAILGDGIIDLVDVFRALREVRFREDASLSIEYETNEDDPYDDLARALDNAAVAAQASRR